jgi:hypothetical protein
MAFTPFRSAVKAGRTVRLYFQVRNEARRAMTVESWIVLPDRWKATPERRKIQVLGKGVRKAGFQVRVPRNTPEGRYVLASETRVDGRLIGEGAVALVDVV